MGWFGGTKTHHFRKTSLVFFSLKTQPNHLKVRPKWGPHRFAIPQTLQVFLREKLHGWKTVGVFLDLIWPKYFQNTIKMTNNEPWNHDLPKKNGLKYLEIWKMKSLMCQTGLEIHSSFSMEMNHHPLNHPHFDSTMSPLTKGTTFQNGKAL